MESICDKNPKCIHYFEVKVRDYSLDGKEFDVVEPYCKYNVELALPIVECPFYKHKVNNKIIKDKIKEEQKHKDRIKRQRVRFNNKR